MVQVEVREIRGVRGTQIVIAALKMKWAAGKECGLPLGAENGPKLTARRKWGPHSYHLKGMNSATNLNKSGNGFFPRASR